MIYFIILELIILLKKLKAFKNCKFDLIEKEIGAGNNELLGTIMNIAKNQLDKVKKILLKNN